MAGGESELRSVEWAETGPAAPRTPGHHHHPTLLAYYTTLHLDTTARGEVMHVSVGN